MSYSSSKNKTRRIQGGSADRLCNRRGRICRSGFVLLDGQSSGLPCTVRGLSDTGATLALGGWIGVPDSFHLRLEPDGRRVACRVVAKRGGAMQVRFE